MTNFRLFQTHSLQTTISYLMKMVETSPKGAPPGLLSGERVGLMTCWLRVRSPVEVTFLSGIFSPLTSAEAHEKSSWWLRKEKLQ